MHAGTTRRHKSDRAPNIPRTNDPNYPDDIQATEAKIAAQGQAAGMNAAGGVPMASNSQAGRAVAMSDTQSLYAHP